MGPQERAGIHLNEILMTALMNTKELCSKSSALSRPGVLISSEGQVVTDSINEGASRNPASDAPSLPSVPDAEPPANPPFSTDTSASTIRHMFDGKVRHQRRRSD